MSSQSFQLQNLSIQEIKMEELNEFLEKVVYSSPIPLVIHQIQVENFDEITTFLTKFIKPQEIVFPNIKCKNLRPQKIYQNQQNSINIMFQKFYQDIEKIVSESPKLKQVGYKNKNNDDLTNISKSQARLQICEIKVVEQESIDQRYNNLISRLFKKGNDQILKDLILLYDNTKQSNSININDSSQLEQNEVLKKLILQEIKLNQFQCSSNYQEKKNVYCKGRTYFHI
ncbi:unnamed protein product [Paramecium sonneborni]|uniref:Uncharacterized protein n=1 Tax=Paramecium sonneborni TaxID=65129 RepID=A0A8S1Q7F8_9CILI|nr:unnamed protein product [Paramecium sonneborni]